MMGKARVLFVIVALLTLIGTASALVGQQRLAISVAVVLAGAAVGLLLEAIRRVTRSAEKIEKMRSALRGRERIERIEVPSRGIEPVAVMQMAMALDASVDRVVAAIAMERLAQADRHKELRRDISDLRSALDAHIGSDSVRD